MNHNFTLRHIGPRPEETGAMLQKIGVESLDQLIEQTVPNSIRLKQPLALPEGISEFEYYNEMREIASLNKNFRSYIGMGYYGTITPAVIQRNILENPSWYTSYTPYQAEISQGRLEALLNYQTVVCELTAMDIANASLLDEATAAAEAMIMFYNSRNRDQIKNNANIFYVDTNVFAQTIDVLKTRAVPLGIEVKVADFSSFEFTQKTFACLVQYPNANGEIINYKELTEKAHAAGNFVAVCADILSLAILTPPGEWGADVVCGSSQRLGVPMGYGGPHAGFFAARDQFKRVMPGRIIGISKDAQGNRALRMSLQTREQHIKRERATSNICTAQALLATMAGMYAVYHGEEGLMEIAAEVNFLSTCLAAQLKMFGYKILHKNFFDTIQVEIPSSLKIEDIQKASEEMELNFFYPSKNVVSISLDETTTADDVDDIVVLFANLAGKEVADKYSFDAENSIPEEMYRKSDFMQQEVFSKYHCETEMMRYIKKLERKDISLTHSMISLGSCTMKLNAAVEMFALSLPEFNAIHPFAPKNQVEGYSILIEELEEALGIVTGLPAVSLQPNSGANGEYAGLQVIMRYHEAKGQNHRNVVLIPSSAHGTNPASAAMAGMKIIVTACDANGNIDVEDLRKKAEENSANLAAFMVTYPSTHGVFEVSIQEMCGIIHQHGGLVYMDGANMNAQVGLTNPASIGADVCHLNLHKTFAIPHGGGGPGVGPICVKEELRAYLPQHVANDNFSGKQAFAVAAAPYGSASVLTITHAYIRMMGGKGLEEATKYAILNANYLAACLGNLYPVLYTGAQGRVAHEMIFDCRPIKTNSGITETDIAKRLMDYGFHAPTLSFPVHGTLMVEPTESESLQELDRFVDALTSIYAEITEVQNKQADANDNVLKNAPHTQFVVAGDDWSHGYSRTKAAFPLTWVAENKFWPSVGRLDDAFGDRNLVCKC